MGPVSKLQTNTADTEEDSQYCTQPVADIEIEREQIPTNVSLEIQMFKPWQDH